MAHPGLGIEGQGLGGSLPAHNYVVSISHVAPAKTKEMFACLVLVGWGAKLLSVLGLMFESVYSSSLARGVRRGMGYDDDGNIDDDADVKSQLKLMISMKMLLMRMRMQMKMNMMFMMLMMMMQIWMGMKMIIP